jgi:hypothetical protein
VILESLVFYVPFFWFFLNVNPCLVLRKLMEGRGFGVLGFQIMTGRLRFRIIGLRSNGW